MKEYLRIIAEKLNRAQKDGRIIRYRITTTQSRSIESGAASMDFRGGYFPTVSQEILNGTYLFEWPNKKLSKGYLGRASLNNFSSFLKESKETAFIDEYGDNFPKPVLNPKIKTSFQETRILYSEPEKKLQEWIETLSGWQNKINSRGSHYIKAMISIEESAVISSQGLNLNAESSSVHIISAYDNKVSLEGHSRKPINLTELQEKREITEEIFKILNKPLTKKPKKGEWRVLFHPDIFRDMLFKLFFFNLNGFHVVEDQSKFELDDFKKQKVALRPDITISTDPTEDGKMDSYNFTKDGIPSKKTTFIRKGKLITPILGPKSARKTKMEPTAKINRHMDTTIIESENNQNFDKFISKQKKALLFYSALGMHGQEPTTGNYSLPCPYAILIENGEMVGNAPCVVNGNIFEDFNNPETVFLNHPTEHPPALATTASVVFT